MYCSSGPTCTHFFGNRRVRRACVRKCITVLRLLVERRNSTRLFMKDIMRGILEDIDEKESELMKKFCFFIFLFSGSVNLLQSLKDKSKET